jgi:flagellar biosynthesis protein
LRACALEYEGDEAPKVRWYAEGDAAKHLIDIARQRGVRIESEQEESLLLALKSVRTNSVIPREIYLAIARIYAYLLSERGKQPK